jgi:hypothetical protein
MITLVAAVTFTDVTVEFKAGLETFRPGAGVAVVIAALRSSGASAAALSRRARTG